MKNKKEKRKKKREKPTLGKSKHGYQKTFGLLFFSFNFSLCSWAGCAPAVLKEQPAGWPVEWQKRKLYNTSYAYIYASNDLAAGEVQNYAKKVTQDFKKRTRTKPAKPLLVVTDQSDPAVVGDLTTFYKLSSQEMADAGASTSSVEQRAKKIEEVMLAEGKDVRADLMMMSIPLTSDDLAGPLQFSPNVSSVVNGALVIPTRSTVEQSTRKNMQGELQKRELGLIVQVPLAPVIVFEEHKRVALTMTSRDVALFEHLADHQPDLDKDKKEEILSVYRQRKLDEATYPVMTTLRSVIEEVVDTVVEPFKPQEGEGGGRSSNNG